MLFRKVQSRVLRWMLRATALFGLLLASAIGCVALNAPYYSAKYSPSEDASELGRGHEWLVPIEQTEAHTCGFLALSAIYRAYDLDPEARDLRFRLGVDKAAVPFDKTSLGTIHPDLFRVIEQDGFDIEPLDLEAPECRALLREHLRTHVALVLVQRNELHWIAVEGTRGSAIRVADSIGPAVEECTLTSLFEDGLYSVLMLTPRYTGEGDSTLKSHDAGTAEMARIPKRLKEK